MTLYDISPDLALGGGAGLHGDEVVAFAHALRELQSKTTTVVTGGASGADLALAGITTEDTLKSVLEYESGVPVDRTSVATIFDDDVIHVGDNTTGNKLVVEWYNKTP